MEILTDSVRIIGLLKRLLELRTLLTVRIADEAKEYNTAVIKVSQDKDILYLDELKPESGHSRLTPTTSIKASAHLEGVYVGFKAEIESIGEQDNIPFYRIKIPTKLEYFQRRASVRVSLSAATPLPVKLKSEDGLELEGSLADLSLGGLRVRFKEEIPAQIASGHLFTCSFPIPPENKEHLSCEFVTRAVRYKKPPNQALPFIGGQFRGISRADERQIQKMVMLLQRAAQKKRNE